MTEVSDRDERTFSIFTQYFDGPDQIYETPPTRHGNWPLTVEGLKAALRELKDLERARGGASWPIRSVRLGDQPFDYHFAATAFARCRGDRELLEAVFSETVDPGSINPEWLEDRLGGLGLVSYAPPSSAYPDN